MDFTQIAIIFVFAAAFGLVAKMLRQPLFVGYLLAGIFVSLIGLVSDLSYFEGLSHIGITLLLFLMGLEMSLKDVASVGKTAMLTGLFQMLLSFVFGFITASIFGLGGIASIYVGIALSFSSTIVAVKLISEKEDLVSLYGRISIGILLVQDMVAVLVLMFLTSDQNGFDLLSWGGSFIKAAIIIGAIWYFSKKTIPILFEKFIGGSNEFLFVFSIAWALGVSAFVQKFTGFTLEIGGFLAGLSLSGLPEHLQIATKARPLRDFFLTIFFLVLGTGVVISSGFIKLVIPAIILSLIAIAVHLFSVMTVMGIQGFRRRTSFMAGITISQISEFSLIIAAIGLGLGQIGDFERSLITMIGVITMISSTYLAVNAEKLFEKYKKYLKVFEKKRSKEHSFLPSERMENHVVLVGCDRTGTQIANFLIKKKINFAVVDFDPKVFTRLTAQNIPTVFGDINDEEVMESANVNYSTLVILTTSNLSDNLNFLSAIKNLSNPPKTIFTSSSKTDALKLYESGASYVIVPDIVAGEYIKHLLRSYGFAGKRLEEAGKNHFKRLIFV